MRTRLLYPCSPQPLLTLLCLTLLTPNPCTVTSYPQLPNAAPPPLDRPGSWDRVRVLLRLRAAPVDANWGEEDPPAGPLAAGRRHPERRDQDADGGKGKEALTSIAGGLHAFSREKGGFGFRFGRKRQPTGGWGEGDLGEEEWK